MILSDSILPNKWYHFITNALFVFCVSLQLAPHQILEARRDIPAHMLRANRVPLDKALDFSYDKARDAFSAYDYHG